MIPITAYLVVAAVIFVIGVAGVMTYRNLIVMFMSVELMLNAASLTFVGFSRALGLLDGHVIVFLILTVAAAEVAVGLAMVITIYRNRETINIDQYDRLKW